MINFLLVGVYLLFPILLYLSLLVPIKDFSLERNNFYFSLSLFLATFFLFIYYNNNFIEVSFLYIPLVISYILKRKNTSCYLSIILLFYFSFKKLFPFLSLVILGIYFLIYKFFLDREKYKLIFLNIFIISQSILLILLKVKFYLIIVALITSLMYINLILKLLNKNEFIIDLSIKEKEIEKERKLKTSIFKLTHELKNPLAVCNGYLEMMDLSNQSKTKKYFNILKGEIKRSLTIINDFSSFGKIKKIEKEELDVYYLLEEIKDTLMPMFNSRNADIIIDDDKEIYFEGDYSRLKQVFVNLLKNALEAKDKDNMLINIKARELKNKVKITIKDNGCGMTKEELEHIGDVFYTTKENGSGLGLSYCLEIIDLHGGNINFKSVKDKGTTVTLYFPKFSE